MKSKLRKLVLAGAIGFTVATVAKRLQGGAGSDWQSTAGPDATIPPPPAPPVPPGPGPTPEPEPAPVSEAPARPDPLTDPLPEVERTAEVPVVPSEDKPAS